MIVRRRRHPIVRFAREVFYRIYNFFKQLYWRIYQPETHGAKLIVFNSKGEILLARIGYMQMHWEIPGGKIEKKETPEAAAKRELFEEVGVKIEDVTFAFTICHKIQGKQDTIHYFVAHSDADEFIIDDQEIIDAGWFALDTLPEFRTRIIDEALIKYHENYTINNVRQPNVLN